MSAGAVIRVSERMARAGEETTLLLDKNSQSMDIPSPSFTFARRDRGDGKTTPQAIAHRGYKALHPENTMGAFRGAVEVGSHGIETDIHLSKDSVVVLSHDADLKRCFGVTDKIIDCEWSYLSTLRTLKEPHEAMPRLAELLRYLAEPGNEEIWLMLDIKLDNDSDDVIRLIAETIDSIPASRPWKERIVLGCWAAKYLPICGHYLPGFSISHIGFSTLYARQFLKIPHISFNMLQRAMVGPLGARFLSDCKRQKRAVFLWTVNEEKWMKWSIRKQVDGVLTDDPKKYLDIVKDWDGSDATPREERLGWMDLLSVLWIQVLVLVFGLLFRLKYFRSSKKEKASRAKATDRQKRRIAA